MFVIRNAQQNQPNKYIINEFLTVSLVSILGFDVVELTQVVETSFSDLRTTLIGVSSTFTSNSWREKTLGEEETKSPSQGSAETWNSAAQGLVGTSNSAFTQGESTSVSKSIKST